jgi:adenine-specific DNA methylase
MGIGMDALVSKSGLAPFSLKDSPSLIERVWPAQKISVETQKERKAVQGQTITTLGTYWKGRKPLFLVRACVLGRVDGFDQDEGTGQSEERGEVSRRLLTA